MAMSHVRSGKILPVVFSAVALLSPLWAVAEEPFSAQGPVIWDGAETQDGSWIAHPLAKRPERVLVRNLDTGEEAVAAIFRREPEVAGPPIVISSTIARDLGMKPGVAAVLSINALNVTAPQAAAPQPAAPQPVVGEAAPGAVTVAPLAAPAAAEPARPAEPAPRAEAPRQENTAAPKSRPARAAAAASPAPQPRREKPAPAAPAHKNAPLPGSYLQVGTFSVAGNAYKLAERLKARGQPALVVARELSIGAAHIVIIGPLNEGARDKARADAAAEGIKDAIMIEVAR